MPDPLPAAAAGSSVCEASGDVREGRGRANSCCCTLLLLKMPAQPAARCISWQRSDRQRQRKQKGQAREAFASAGAGAAAAAHPPACVAQCDLQSRSPAGTGRAPPRSLQAQGRAGKRQVGRQARGRQARGRQASRQAGRQATASCEWRGTTAGLQCPKQTRLQCVAHCLQHSSAPRPCGACCHPRRTCVPDHPKHGAHSRAAIGRLAPIRHRAHQVASGAANGVVVLQAGKAGNACTWPDVFSSQWRRIEGCGDAST
jgi:hypothetical protein